MLRSVPLTLSILFFAARISSATNDTNSGVPLGWSVDQYNNRGYEFLNKHKYAEARKYFDAAIRVEPDHWRAYYNRATSFYMEGKWTSALEDLSTTIRLKPAFFLASFERALIYEKVHNYAAALKDFDALAKGAFQVANSDELAMMLNQRAWIHATCYNAAFRNGQLALRDAKKACELTKWKDPMYMDTLAAAYAETGDFDSAIRLEQQAIQTRKKDVGDKDKRIINKNTTPGMIQHLELYKRHRPLRDEAGSL